MRSARLMRSDTVTHKPNSRARLLQETMMTVLPTPICDQTPSKHLHTNHCPRSATNLLPLGRHLLSSMGLRALGFRKEFITPSRHTARRRPCISKLRIPPTSNDECVKSNPPFDLACPQSRNFKRIPFLSGGPLVSFWGAWERFCIFLTISFSLFYYGLHFQSAVAVSFCFCRCFKGFQGNDSCGCGWWNGMEVRWIGMMSEKMTTLPSFFQVNNGSVLRSVLDF